MLNPKKKEKGAGEQMKQKTQLGKRLASAAMAVMLTGTSAAGKTFPSYGALDPEQTFGKQPITAVLGAGSVAGGLSFSGSVLLADEQADPCAGQLFAYLKAVGESPYVLYGHQNDTHHKGGEDYPGSTSSDTKDITGSISAIAVSMHSPLPVQRCLSRRERKTRWRRQPMYPCRRHRRGQF